MYNLKDLQNKELDMLQTIHDVCEKIGVEYIIMHGTLLGAVRHKGFIPWDDDIDICMTRENYDLFLDLAPRYLPDGLSVQHVMYESECPNIFAKVRDKNTTFLHEEHVNLDINQGVFIDVFPIERIKSNKIQIYFEYSRRRLFAIINECFDLAYVNSIKRSLSRKIGLFIHYTICQFILLFEKRNTFISNEDNRRKKLHANGDETSFISIYRNITGDYSLFTERQLYSFEGHSFYGPKNYDFILSSLYGDYMKIPSKDKQITHHPLVVDLDRGYNKEEIEELLSNRNCSK